MSAQELARLAAELVDVRRRERRCYADVAASLGAPPDGAREPWEHRLRRLLATHRPDAATWQAALNLDALPNAAHARRLRYLAYYEAMDLVGRWLRDIDVLPDHEVVPAADDVGRQAYDWAMTAVLCREPRYRTLVARRNQAPVGLSFAAARLSFLLPAAPPAEVPQPATLTEASFRAILDLLRRTAAANVLCLRPALADIELSGTTALWRRCSRWTTASEALRRLRPDLLDPAARQAFERRCADYMRSELFEAERRGLPESVASALQAEEAETATFEAERHFAPQHGAPPFWPPTVPLAGTLPYHDALLLLSELTRVWRTLAKEARNPGKRPQLRELLERLRLCMTTRRREGTCALTDALVEALVLQDATWQALLAGADERPTPEALRAAQQHFARLAEQPAEARAPRDASPSPSPPAAAPLPAAPSSDGPEAAPQPDRPAEPAHSPSGRRLASARLKWPLPVPALHEEELPPVTPPPSPPATTEETADDVESPPDGEPADARAAASPLAPSDDEASSELSAESAADAGDAAAGGPLPSGPRPTSGRLKWLQWLKKRAVRPNRSARAREDDAPPGTPVPSSSARDDRESPLPDGAPAHFEAAAPLTSSDGDESSDTASAAEEPRSAGHPAQRSTPAPLAQPNTPPAWLKDWTQSDEARLEADLAATYREIETLNQQLDEATAADDEAASNRLLDFLMKTQQKASELQILQDIANDLPLQVTILPPQADAESPTQRHEPTRKRRKMANAQDLPPWGETANKKTREQVIAQLQELENAEQQRLTDLSVDIEKNWRAGLSWAREFTDPGEAMSGARAKSTGPPPPLTREFIAEAMSGARAKSTGPPPPLTREFIAEAMSGAQSMSQPRPPPPRTRP